MTIKVNLNICNLIIQNHTKRNRKKTLTKRRKERKSKIMVEIYKLQKNICKNMKNLEIKITSFVHCLLRPKVLIEKVICCTRILLSKLCRKLAVSQFWQNFEIRQRNRGKSAKFVLVIYDATFCREYSTLHLRRSNDKVCGWKGNFLLTYLFS